MSRSTLRLALVLVAALAPAGPLWAQMEHVLFITNIGYSIRPSCNPRVENDCFGGPDALSDADAQCMKRSRLFPDSSGVDINAKALLSSSAENANARMEIIGRVVNMHGDVLANNQADLWDGTIANPIKYNEFGGLLPAFSEFWTGSNSYGYASANAQNWTQTVAQLANIGTSSDTVNWFFQVQLAANQSYRLPCLCEARVIDPGEFNDDGLVDAADYVVWRKTMGHAVDRGVAADGDGDGMVTDLDYAVWRSHLGTNYLAGSGAATPVPEPAALPLALMASIWFFIKPRPLVAECARRR